jgi:hypothetical protein
MFDGFTHFLRAIFSSKFFWVFLGITSIYFFYLLIFWPGIHSIDGYYYLINISEPHTSLGTLDYESFFYGLLIFILLPPLKSFLLFSLLQILLATGVTAYSFYIIQRYLKSYWYFAPVLFFLLINPIAAQMVLVTERDILFSWLIALGFLIIVKISITKMVGHLEKFALAISFCLAAGIRKEAVIFLLLLPLQLTFFKLEQKKIFHIFLKCTFFLILVFILIPLMGKERNKSYSLGGGYDVGILKLSCNQIISNFKLPLTAEDKKFISILYEIPEQAPSWDVTRWVERENLSIEQSRQYSVWAVKFLIKNRVIYGKTRVRHLINSITNPTIERHQPEYASQLHNEAVLKIEMRNGKAENSLFPNLRTRVLKLNEKIFMGPLFWFFFPPSVALIVTILLILGAPFQSEMRKILILWAPQMAFFVFLFIAAPIIKPKYYYSTYICGVLLFPFILFNILHVTSKRSTL